MIALAVGSVLSVLVLLRPPIDLTAIARVVAGLALVLFLFAMVVFWRLYRERNIVLQITEAGLGVRHTPSEEVLFVPWERIAGYRYSFGVFSVVLEGGEILARVDSIIDGFFALLYHVNRHTFRRA